MAPGDGAAPQEEDRTMLVLTRRLMEKLYIGDDIIVTVVRLEGGQVRLGIEAPRNVPIVRAELIGKPASAGSGSGADPSEPALAATPTADGATLRTPQASAPGTGIRRPGRSR
jgi:carbon storage regulator